MPANPLLVILYTGKCYLACTVILGSFSCIFRNIQALFKSILTHIQNLLYPWYILNPGIFPSQRIFRLLTCIHNFILHIFTKPPSSTFDTVLHVPLFYRMNVNVLNVPLFSILSFLE